MSYGFETINSSSGSINHHHHHPPPPPPPPPPHHHHHHHQQPNGMSPTQTIGQQMIMANNNNGNVITAQNDQQQQQWRPKPKRGISLDSEFASRSSPTIDEIDDNLLDDLMVPIAVDHKLTIVDNDHQCYRTSSSMSDDAGRNNGWIRESAGNSGTGVSAPILIPTKNNNSNSIGKALANHQSFQFSSEEITHFKQQNDSSVDANSLGEISGVGLGCGPSSGRSTRATTPGDEQIFQEPVESLQVRIGRLLSCEEMADMHFLIGSAGQPFNQNYSSSPSTTNQSPSMRKLRIPAHRLVMASASAVFKRVLVDPATGQFVSDFSEADIEISDIEPASFLEFLRYAYTDSARLNKDNVVGVLITARRYQITTLENQCIEYIHKCLGKKSCMAVWLTARQYGERELEMVSRKSVQHFAETVLLSNDFARADQLAISELLSDDLLRADEIVVFRALTRWAKQACLRNSLCPNRANVRLMIGNMLNLIRFPLMSEEQLQRMVAAEGILEDELLRSLVHCSRNWPRVSNMISSTSPSMAFSNEPRAFQRLNGRLHNVYRFASFENSLLNRYLNRSLNFLANKRVWLSGVGLYAPRKACTFYLNVWVRVRRADFDSQAWNSPLDRAEQTVLLKYDGSGHIININFDEPLQVEANVQYEVNATITPTTRSTSLVRARLHPHLYYTRPNEVNFYYGTEGQYATKVRINNRNENVIFNFNWERDQTNLQDESLSDSTSNNNFYLPAANSEPATPANPPPRPPPPQEYRRPSRMQRLRRALSFVDRRDESLNSARENGLLEGQIPLLMFYA